MWFFQVLRKKTGFLPLKYNLFLIEKCCTGHIKVKKTLKILGRKSCVRFKWGWGPTERQWGGHGNSS